MPLEERDMQQQEVEQEEVLRRRRWKCSQHGWDSRSRAVGGWGLECCGEEEQEEMI